MENNLEMVAAIDKIAEKFGIVIDWTAKNVVPQVQDILERYCDFLIFKNIIYMIIIILTIIGVVWVLVVIVKENEEELDEAGFGTLIVGGLGLLFLILTFIEVTFNIIELFTCPEVYIIELLA